MLVVLAKESGPPKRARQPPRPVHDTPHYGRVAIIRSCNGIDVQHGDSQTAAFQWNGENIHGVVVLDRLRDLLQIRGQILAMKLADQNLGETWLWCYAACAASGPVRGIVDRKGCLIQVALKLESGLLNEVFVFRIVSDRGPLGTRADHPHPLEIYVEKCVGARQQAGSFRGSVLSKLHGKG